MRGHLLVGAAAASCWLLACEVLVTVAVHNVLLMYLSLAGLAVGVAALSRALDQLARDRAAALRKRDELRVSMGAGGRIRLSSAEVDAISRRAAR